MIHVQMLGFEGLLADDWNRWKPWKNKMVHPSSNFTFMHYFIFMVLYLFPISIEFLDFSIIQNIFVASCNCTLPTQGKKQIIFGYSGKRTYTSI